VTQGSFQIKAKHLFLATIAGRHDNGVQCNEAMDGDFDFDGNASICPDEHRGVTAQGG
jgi:hypothetical protein